MNVDVISNPGLSLPQQPKIAEQVDSERKTKNSVLKVEQPTTESQKIQPEELLDQIKSLAQDGVYSVRFEKSEDVSDVVVKIFDNETKEVVRQIPAEELLDFKATFEELRGNLVNTAG